MSLSHAAQLPQWLIDSKNDYESNEIIQEINELDKRFYKIIDQKTYIDPAYLDGSKLKKSANVDMDNNEVANGFSNFEYTDHLELANYTDITQVEAAAVGVNNVKDQVDIDDGTLTASDGINWFDNVSREESALDILNDEQGIFCCLMLISFTFFAIILITN